MEQTQYLDKKQIEGILEYITKKVIDPAMEAEIDRITLLYADKKIEVDKIYKNIDKQLSSLGIDTSNVLYPKEQLFKTIVQNDYCFDKWICRSEIIVELEARLRLTIAGNFDNIVQDMLQYIDVTKYIKLIEVTA